MTRHRAAYRKWWPATSPYTVSIQCITATLQQQQVTLDRGGGGADSIITQLRVEELVVASRLQINK